MAAMESKIFLSILIALLPQRILSEDCPPEFNQVDGIGCFMLDSSENRTWEEAREFCETSGGYLAEVSSEKYQALLTNAIRSEAPGDYWIGLHDTASEGQFTWDYTGHAANFTAWGNNQPNGLELENCVAMRENRFYFWTDEDCQIRHWTICEAPSRLNPCGSGWTLISQTQMCYLFNPTDTMDFYSAQAYCQSIGNGSKLAEPKDEALESALQSYISNNYVADSWIGLTDETDEGRFVWQSDGTPADYFDWDTGTGQPDSGTRGNCVVLYNSMLWYDTYCGEFFAFQPLCERSLN
eukprot:maker-scaffold275_size226830-snap-gene-1.30 protein:Tk00639 transcript:maker-scaffold275_size226830-snap-gene-1.30-mRNA-1 annotation:"predicted protein"